MSELGFYIGCAVLNSLVEKQGLNYALFDLLKYKYFLNPNVKKRSLRYFVFQPITPS